ncbi:uncharacterized protein SPPG_01152 [Spizellomyces punctatus DAOM BR117]|uniref:Uncharacterized protein n=1 Tax=Spizellomyces punctatus (strain DAOM BR117) TaxID=645134 RepID=A0A0L0HS12_SPIPD|nr:uncharacterized protein SPPG_01152 [Spizellomyces punctatus DAOM BR117]KND03685.1 hypothetical protein SPPG_01152 [Spizellomyces punctatus DAOM BR117]|eukprot:XP_016611724.1 hypothetical protein SPPG_01152 [Spizellomyces punctatus DAOM BR117]
MDLQKEDQESTTKERQSTNSQIVDPTLQTLRQLSNFIPPTSPSSNDQQTSSTTTPSAHRPPMSLEEAVLEDPAGVFAAKKSEFDAHRQYLLQMRELLKQAEDPEIARQYLVEFKDYQARFGTLKVKTENAGRRSKELKAEIQKETTLIQQYSAELARPKEVKATWTSAVKGYPYMEDINSFWDLFPLELRPRKFILPVIALFLLIIYTVIDGSSSRKQHGYAQR